MSRRLIAGSILALALINITGLLSVNNKVYGETVAVEVPKGNEIQQTGTVLGTSDIKMKTETAFDVKEDVIKESIDFSTEYVEDKEMEYGKEKLLEKGENGVRTLTYKVTFWVDEEIDRQLIKTEVENPKPEKIAKGTKIIWREFSTPDVGGVWYWQKLRVWATKYDGNCYGCSGRTFSGTTVVKGVCAVDPKVIKLGTNFYVEGYGICRAEDIGGAIKGNKIDLGFEDASKGNWGAAYTNVYLLSNSPQGDRK